MSANDSKGKHRVFSSARRALQEFLRIADRVPLVAVEREANFSTIVEARKKVAEPCSWTVILAKAFALAAKEHELMRTSYLPMPWPRLYVHPTSLAVVFVEREWQGEKVVLPTRLRKLESSPLSELQRNLDIARNVPVFEYSQFRRYLRLGQMPLPLRRFVCWQTINISGAMRVRRMGTFMISSLGKEGALIQRSTTPLTSYLSFGPIDSAGRCKLMLSFDHRVLDGMEAARFLKSVEMQACTAIVAELNSGSNDSPLDLPTRDAA